MNHKQMCPPDAGTDKTISNVWSRHVNYNRHNPSTTHPLPPYGMYACANHIGRENVWIQIHVGDKSWQCAKTWIENGVLALVLPVPYKFQIYRWPVKNLDVLLHWPRADPTQVYDFGSLLIKSGASCVLHPYGTGTWLYPLKVAS